MKEEIIKKIISIIEHYLSLIELVKNLVGSLCQEKKIKRQDIILYWLDKKGLTVEDLFKEEGRSATGKIIDRVSIIKLKKYLAGEIKYSGCKINIPKPEDIFWCREEENAWIEKISVGLQVPVWTIETILRG